MDMCVLSFNKEDSDAQKLGKALDIPVLDKLEYDSYSSRFQDLLTINWGTYWQPELYRGLFINYPGAVRNACHKEVAFSMFRRDHLPHSGFVFDHRVALEWNKTEIVVGRDTLKGRRSQGMVCYDKGEMQKDGPGHFAYAKAVDTAREYRFHIFRGECIHAMEKVKDEDKFPKAVKKYGNKAHKIRSSLYGWHYSSAGLARTPPSIICGETARDAVKSLGLDFGAVDICEDSKGHPWVFEVNTAPDLFGQNGRAYANAIKQYVSLLI